MIALKTCPTCGSIDKDDSSLYCQDCGYQFPSPSHNLETNGNVYYQNKGNNVQTYGSALGIILLLMAIVFFVAIFTIA